MTDRIILDCTECGSQARWNIWFAGWPLYGFVCDYHASEYLQDGKDGWPVACVKIMTRQFLGSDDPAIIKMDEEQKRRKTMQPRAVRVTVEEMGGCDHRPTVKKRRTVNIVSGTLDVDGIARRIQRDVDRWRTEPRELTEDEARSLFLRYIWEAIDEWESYPSRTIRERLSGLAHTVLAMLDGEGVDIPGFIVAPDPGSDARQYHSERGETGGLENYGHALDGHEANCNLGGTLHDAFYGVDK